MESNARNYFLKEDHSCAETVFKAGCEAVGLEYTDDMVKALGSFSGGCTVGHLCGAAAGAIAVIGMKYGAGKIHQSPIHKEKVKEFMQNFQKTFEDTMCCELVKTHKKADIRCYELVEKSLELLEATISG